MFPLINTNIGPKGPHDLVSAGSDYLFLSPISSDFSHSGLLAIPELTMHASGHLILLFFSA